MAESLVGVLVLAALFAVYRLGRYHGRDACCAANGIVTGKAAQRILDEIRNGTPNTPQRVEQIRRADQAYKAMRSRRADEQKGVGE